MSQLIYSVYEINNKADLLKQSGIYRITNVINNKCYIGSSVNIYKRWKTHINELKRKKHANIFLSRSWDKYGEDNFKFEVVEFCSKFELLEKEESYIAKFESFGENGYNLTDKALAPFLGKFGKDHPCFGRVLTEREIQIVSLNLKNYWNKFRENKDYKVLTPKGELVVFNNLDLFCKEHNILSKSSFFQILTNKRKTYKGYRHPDCLLEKQKIYIFEYNSLYTVDWKHSLTEFSKFFDLHRQAVCRIVNRERKKYKNWKFIGIKEKDYELFIDRNPSFTITCSIDGKE